jgi:hypothetical protein
LYLLVEHFWAFGRLRNRPAFLGWFLASLMAAIVSPARHAITAPYTIYFILKHHQSFTREES